jgi:excisionase family DNA binding protein
MMKRRGIVELTVKEFAREERVTERTVRNWIVKGAISVRRTPGRGVRILVFRGGSPMKGEESSGNADM